ncbi:hypothetical protein ACOMHN_044503 [Nucella lapillus]
MAAYSNFRSSDQIDAERQELRDARNTVLEKAKGDYERSERRREKARQAGEGTWMLSSVTERIEKEQKTMEKVKEKKKKDKKKKKKHKKEKKRKRKSSSSSDTESSEDEAAWVEKGSEKKPPRPVSGPSLQRESWMESPLVTDIIPTVTRAELREKKRGEDREREEAAKRLEQPGQHTRELNPYWKEGGTGLPEKRPAQTTDPLSSASPSMAGDGGLSWLRKAQERCQQQAKEEGRSLEDVAAERYGRRREAAAAAVPAPAGADKADIFPGDGANLSATPARPTERAGDRAVRKVGERAAVNVTMQMRGKEGRTGWTEPDDDDADNGFAESRRQVSSRGDRQQKSSGGWRKKPLPQTGREEAGRRGLGSREGRRKPSPSSSSQSDSSSSSSSGSGSEAEEEGRSSGRREEEAAPVVKMLSEDEMNSLGARILRAELMGDEDMARQLKSQLEQAQKVKESAASKAQGSEVTPSSKPSGRAGEEEEKVVVLTRTGRDGMVRPLPEQEFGLDKGGKKKRRKQKNVKTHSGDGKRARYFDDDDRHDLKTLVQMEKLGTAEDQNTMFSRLAGKSTERTDEDFQVDDVFVSKAARQQSGARNEEKERSKAIFEHRKVSAAMEKCQLCFNNIPKHLLIAIGSKVYLSLPAHRSLTPGHCLIVPMQHVSAATALDEDVWQEIQTFRKHLVQMFVAQDQDIVFMETTMHLRHFPHMALECIPLDREVGDLAPIYFKKAMQDAGPEWSSNKKVVELSRKDIRHSVPKGFPYFSVDFGLQGGYAHVIENEKTFPSYFGREIVGGMIDAEPGLWRKPHREGFEDQRQKVLEFEKLWKPYDFTNPS